MGISGPVDWQSQQQGETNIREAWGAEISQVVNLEKHDDGREMQPSMNRSYEYLYIGFKTRQRDVPVCEKSNVSRMTKSQQ